MPQFWWLCLSGDGATVLRRDISDEANALGCHWLLAESAADVKNSFSFVTDVNKLARMPLTSLLQAMLMFEGKIWATPPLATFETLLQVQYSSHTSLSWKKLTGTNTLAFGTKAHWRVSYRPYSQMIDKPEPNTVAYFSRAWETNKKVFLTLTPDNRFSLVYPVSPANNFEFSRALNVFSVAFHLVAFRPLSLWPP